jgi:F0F1-type ATP synthase membrane subunit b/b'
MITTLISAFIALSIAVGSFYWGRHISSIQQRNKLLETTHDSALKHIEELERHLEELQQENEFIRKEAQSQDKRVSAHRGWNPADPLNSSERQ